MSNFLQKELLNDQYVNLKQAGHTIDYEDVTLARVFVDLPISDERKTDPPNEDTEKGLPPGIIGEVLSLATEHLDPKSLSLESEQQQNDQLPLSTRQKRGRFVVIGGPGQGKTTVGQFLCQVFRASIINKRPDVLYDKVRNALDEIKELCEQEKIELPPVPRFPFRIVLSDFAARLASDGSINSLVSYIVDRIRARTNQEITADHLRSWLAQYPWLLIFDGLDEVPASSNREEILSAIDSFWIDVTSANADVLVVATTRPQGYNEEFAANLYQHKWLVPLSVARAMHYAKRLVRVRYKEDKDRQTKILERLQSALADEATAKLMRSPLQVTIMADLVDRIGKPPQERWSLFQKYYTVIYQRETERDIPAASVLRNYEPDINAIHYRVGLMLQIETEYSGRTGARLSLERFANIVESRLVEEGHEGKDLADLKKHIIEAATDRLVFLVGVEANEIGFEIRSLQEFMAAEALMGASDDLLLKRLRQIAPVVNWRSVFLFAAGKCFALEDRQHLRETIRGICVDLNESEVPRDEAYRTTLSGSQLALDLLEDGPAQRQPKYAKSLARLACRLWDLPPSNYHIRLADLFDAKLEDVYLTELEKHLQSTESMRLGAWNSISRLVENHVTFAEALANTYWPSNEEEQIELLKVAVDQGATLQMGRLNDIFSRLSPSYLSHELNRHYKDSKLPQEPTWLKAFLGPHQTSTLNLQISDEKRLNRAFEMRIISNGYMDWMRSLKNMSNPNSEWLPYCASARFLENPSKKSLAFELRNIAQHFASKFSNDVLNNLPWPLESLLKNAKSKEDLVKLAFSVEQGEFGDAEDWIAAEKRWLNQGISLRDLDYMADGHLPFDRKIGEIGIPLFSVEISNFLIESPTDARFVCESLLALRSNYGQSNLRTWFADCISFVIMIGLLMENQRLYAYHDVEVEKNKLSGVIGFNLFQELIKETNEDSAILIQSPLPMDLTNPNRDELIDFIDYLGREKACIVPLRFMLLKSKEIVDSLSEMFLSHPDHLGILDILSKFAFEGYSLSIPNHLLSPEKYKVEPKYQKAAIAVRLAQQDWDETEARLMARHTIELSKSDFTIIDEMLKVVETPKKKGAPIDTFLVEWLRGTQITDWSTRKRILDALDKSLRYRTSRLTDVWEELGLPSSLKTIIRIGDAVAE